MVKSLYIRRDFPMTKITLRRIFSKHVLLKRTQFRLTQAQLAEAVGTSHGWIQKIESGKKMPGFFLAIKLAVFLEIDMNSFLKDLMEASGTPITASKRQESLVHTHAAKESGDTEVTGHVQV
jgi:DNA-binding helix-turn-helix protein